MQAGMPGQHKKLQTKQLHLILESYCALLHHRKTIQYKRKKPPAGRGIIKHWLQALRPLSKVGSVVSCRKVWRPTGDRMLRRNLPAIKRTMRAKNFSSDMCATRPSAISAASGSTMTTTPE